MPSKVVDVGWHEMILRTREYHEFCRRAFGEYLHHTPDSLLDVPMSQILPPTLRVIDQHDLPMVLFTADADAGIDDGYEWSSVELRRMREQVYATPTARKRRRSSWASSGGAGYAGSDGGGWWFGGGGDGG